jgi:hypothetical protein
MILTDLEIQPDLEGVPLIAAACPVVVHMTPHRIRVKIPGWERRETAFVTLQRRLERCPGVIHVRVNPLVASVVIHRGDQFQLASALHCFAGLEVVLPAYVAGNPKPQAWQIASSEAIGYRPAVSGRLAAVAFDLVMAIWTRRLEGLITEWIFQAVAQVLLRQLCRSLIPAPRPQLAAAAA